MAPMLHPGDTVVVLPTDSDNLHPGAIIVVREDGGLLTHRLMAFDGGRLLLRGDAALTPDQPVAAEALVGVVVARERGHGRLGCDSPEWALLGRALALSGSSDVPTIWLMAWRSVIAVALALGARVERR